MTRLTCQMPDIGTGLSGVTPGLHGRACRPARGVKTPHGFIQADGASVMTSKSRQYSHDSLPGTVCRAKGGWNPCHARAIGMVCHTHTHPTRSPHPPWTMQGRMRVVPPSCHQTYLPKFLLSRRCHLKSSVLGHHTIQHHTIPSLFSPCLGAQT